MQNHDSPALRLPKVLLHDHLDGGLRLSTLLELLHQRGMNPPQLEEPALGAWFQANANAGSLEKYLEGFGLTVAAMASPEALRRVAREAAQDAHAQGVVLAEFRIAPLLFEPFGIGGEAAVEALLQGLSEAPMPCGLILCAMRHLPLAQTERAAKLALKYQGQGVVAFDLAGPEQGFPPSLHTVPLQRVRDAGLGITLHAGEADAAERVLEAARLGAKRIGHGVRLADALHDPARRHLVDEVKALGVHLEVCPTSNVHTGASASVAAHPITALWQAGMSLSYHTDNTLISCLTHSSEAEALLRDTPLTVADLLAMARQAAQASFMPAPAVAAALAAIDAFRPQA
jgi:adenosine deaminase